MEPDVYNSIIAGVFIDDICSGYIVIPDDFQKMGEGHLKKSAAALYIHRNSLVYRLEKINEIIATDYEAPHIREHLKLSCYILKNRTLFEQPVVY